MSSPASVAGSSGFAAKSEKPISEHLVRVRVRVRVRVAG